MKPETERHCLACGRSLPKTSAVYESCYTVCARCADILREDYHTQHAQVVREVCRGIDSFNSTQLAG